MWFSNTHWTFHFKTAAKHAISQPQARISSKPGLTVLISVVVRSFSLALSEQSQYLLRNVFSGGIIGFMGVFPIELDLTCLFK